MRKENSMFRKEWRLVKGCMKALDKDIEAASPREYESTVKELYKNIHVNEIFEVEPVFTIALAMRQSWKAYENRKTLHLKRDEIKRLKAYLIWLWTEMDYFGIDNWNMPIVGTTNPTVKLVVKQRLKVIIENIASARAGAKKENENNGNKDNPEIDTKEVK